MLVPIQASIDNILSNDGIGIALTGMTIVFTALVLISLFIAVLPRALASLSGILPPEEDHHHHKPPAAETEEAVIAAIGFALHTRSRDKSRSV